MNLPASLPMQGLEGQTVDLWVVDKVGDLRQRLENEVENVANYWKKKIAEMDSARQDMRDVAEYWRRQTDKLERENSVLQASMSPSETNAFFRSIPGMLKYWKRR